MTRRNPQDPPETLDYARPRDPAADIPHPVERAVRRHSRFRMFWLITRIIYLIICLAIFAFIWKYIQGYITLLNTAGQQ